jgi:hypothetical protein
VERASSWQRVLPALQREDQLHIINQGKVPIEDLTVELNQIGVNPGAQLKATAAVGQLQGFIQGVAQITGSCIAHLQAQVIGREQIEDNIHALQATKRALLPVQLEAYAAVELHR